MASQRDRFRQMGRRLALAWRQAGAALANTRRRLFRKHIPEIVVFEVEGSLEELAPELPWWSRYIPGGRPPQSLEALHGALRRVAADPDVKGVLFLLKGAALQRTRAQNLAALIDRFRSWDRAFNPRGAPKSVAFFLEQVTASNYTAACAADRIIVTPLTTWEVLGLYVEAEYYRDALSRVGLRAEVVRVAPWKTAADMLSEAEMSPAAREQYEWLLDSLYNGMVRAIARGRSLDEAAVRSFIDRAPLAAAAAQAAGLIDAVAYEDELPALLGSEGAPARLARYGRVRRLLYRRALPRTEQAVGVLDLSGSIVTGGSQRFPIPLPLLGREMLGSTSVQRQVRTARKRHDLAAVVAYVDSPGGSALASDLMWRELWLLAQEKPLVVYMGPTAASGGYYIAAPGHAIVAQEATLTGSIGVITAKILTEEAYERFGVGRSSVQRGANAALYSDAHPWSEDQREQVESSVNLIYTTFQQRVQAGRKLSAEAVTNVAGGRVWTGEQGVAHGLVDALGDFRLALEKAARLADLEVSPTTDLRVERIEAHKARPLAEPVQAALSLLSLLAQAHTPLELPAAAWESALRADRFWLLAEHLPRLD